MKINTHVSKADLHGHTVNSDGELTVLQLLEIVKEKGLDYYAITDHDCLNGADEAYDLMESGKNPIHMIYGIELSTYNLEESIHVLGYFKTKLVECSLRNKLKEQLENRKIRAQKIFDLLKQHFNIVLDPSKIESRNSLTRGTIAKMIIEAGYPYTQKYIFEAILGDNCPCYIPSTHFSTQEGIDLIHENGGLAVLAHPCLLKKNNPLEIVKMGIDGIEAIYPKTFNEETKYRDMAKKYNLFITAGSDFHYLKDQNHGSVGSCIIKGQDLRNFLEKLNQ